MQIYDGRDSFYQWDTNQKLTATGLKVGDKLHFFNLKQSEPLTLEAYIFENTTVVDVPNILLQSPFPIVVYRWVDDGTETYTTERYEFGVKPRPKPSDYVYTETEVLTYSALEARIKTLEETGASPEQIAELVDQYLRENPIECDGKEPYIVTATESESGYDDYSATFSDMWSAHEAGREVLLSYKGYEYIPAIFIDDEEGRRVHFEWDDKPADLRAHNSVAKHTVLFREDGTLTHGGAQFAVGGLVRFLGANGSGSHYLVPSEAAVIQAFNQLKASGKFINPEALVINGEEYNGSKPVDVTIGWDNLEGRPFGDLPTSASVEWDGNLDGKQSVLLEGTTFVKISDDIVPSVSDVESLTLVVGGQTFTTDDVQGEGESGVWIAFYNDLPALYAITEPLEEAEAAGLSTGLWAIYMDTGDGVYYTSKVTYKYYETTPIPEKYLPPLISPSGKKFKLSVSDDGILTATETTL